MIKKIEEKMIKQLTKQFKKIVSEGKKAGLSKNDIMSKMLDVTEEIYEHQLMDATEKTQGLDTIRQVKEINK